ncbi:MAG: DUF2489 domain-containing protein [Pseudomonadales bacterium]|uniref:DUF2489 domain-containing protein n=1 Tax=Oleiphilus messinensis TaxID=141451 RepID=A0A1Y0I6N9_9GAMM|nr:DUF2489 domain-containing protein [Oleiphilus messinensis]ARU55446.1 hypothetical protein OLMES_1369 [Oleiphilus messinensis]MCG8609628.1 DUF2489 domain-containing protein [Pseudomonadales bacterium]
MALTSSEYWLLSLLGILLSIVLALTIRQQYRKIRQVQAQQAQVLEKHIQQKSETWQSIQIIARCIDAQQVDLAEGCIRIKVLLDAVQPDLHQDARFEIFNQVYELTEHMPTHGARNEMDKRFRWKLDKQRYAIEHEHQEAIETAARALLEHIQQSGHLTSSLERNQ